MPNLPLLPSKDVLSYLLKYGCVLISVRGSHHKVEYPISGRRTTIPVHAGRDMDRAFLKAILDQLDIDAQDFAEFVR